MSVQASKKTQVSPTGAVVKTEAGVAVQGTGGDQQQTVS